MGLGSVEMVMRVEEEFGIGVPDATAESWRVVGDVASFVLSARERGRERWPGVRDDWARVRSQVEAVVGSGGRAFRPSDRVVDRLTPQQRRRLWRRLRELWSAPGAPGSARGALYPLRRTPGLRRLLSGVAFGGIAAAGIVGYKFGGFEVAAGLLVLGAMAAVGLERLTTGMRSVPRPGHQTLGQLTRRWAGRPAAPNGWGVWTAEQVREHIRAIVADEIGVKIDEVRMESRLVEDLGLD